MAWNYRKRIKIAPGIHLNLSKGGVSTSIGPKGAKISIGKNGAYLNTSIPGTGIYNRQKISNNKFMSGQFKSDSKESGNFLKPRNTWGCVFRWLGIVAFIFLIVNLFQLLTGNFDNSEGNKNAIYGWSFVAALFVIVYYKRILSVFHLDFSKKETKQQSDNVETDIKREKNHEMDAKSQSNDVETEGLQPQIISFGNIEKEQKSVITGDAYSRDNNNINNTHKMNFIDPKLFDIADIIVKEQYCSISQIQRKLAVGYNRTSNIVDQLELIGVVRRLQNYKIEVLVKDSASLASLFKNLKYEGVSENIFGIKEDYYNDVTEIVHALVKLYQDIKADVTVMYAISDCLPQDYGNKDQKLAALFLADTMKVHQHFGHSTTNLKNREGFALVLLSSLILSGRSSLDITYGSVNNLDDLSKDVPSVFSSLCHIFDQYPDDNFFFMGQVLNRCRRRSFYTRYFTLLYRMFSLIAKADNDISENEAIWLNKLLELNPQKDNVNIVFNVGGTPSYKPVAPIAEPNTQETSKQRLEKEETNSTKELQTLIGLSEVKKEVEALANFVKIQKEREKKGMKAVGLSYHCVFTGNPGTGKTTVARILAEIYKDLGILKNGHLVETDRSGLVAEYVGQTAVKTNKIIDSALDGILFIDEAYSLVQGGGNDYGQEAISTLLKRMEDDRDRLIVVLAGYSEDMKRFIDSNPGLQSRFNRYIHFADYTADELNQIFLLNVEKNQYVLDEEGQALLSQILNFAVEHKDKNFGNGRYVRNLFEKTIQNQAMRLSCQPNITAAELSMLKAEDLPTNKQ